MTEEIYTAAAELCSPSLEEEPLLRRFCRAEEQLLLRRMPQLPQLCREVFTCAAGCMAAADLLEGRDSGVEQFTVGDVSVRRKERGGGAALREQARRMLAPYGGGDGFAFLGVRG